MPNPSSGRGSLLRWLGVAPFFLFVTLFLILPSLYIVVGAFRGPDGYRHDEIDDNAQAHLTSVLLGHSVTLSVASGRPVLGTWQSVFLLEMDGPRSRTLDLTFIGDPT